MDISSDNVLGKSYPISIYEETRNYLSSDVVQNYVHIRVIDSRALEVILQLLI